MLAVCLGLYLLAAVLYAAVTMLLSVITQNALAVTCGLLGYLIVDLFAVVPDRFPLLQMIWSFRPNEILMNTGFVNYRLIHFAGRLFMNWQAAPVINVGACHREQIVNPHGRPDDNLILCDLRFNASYSMYISF